VGMLLLLVACGSPYQEPSEKPGISVRSSSAVDETVPCPAAPPGPDLPCQWCDPGGGDPTETVPLTSTHVRALGTRTYSFHPNSIITGTINSRLRNSAGTVIGHVAFGGRYIAGSQNFVSAHIVAPSYGTDVWIRYGRIRSGTGQVNAWIAVRNGYSNRWSRYMTRGGFKAWFATLPAGQRTALLAAAEASTDTAKKQPPGSPTSGLFNADGSCAGTTWLTLILADLATCAEGIVVACFPALTATGYCAGMLIPQAPEPTNPPPTDTNPIPISTDPGATGPNDGGNDGGNGGGMDGSGGGAPEGDGGEGGGAGGCD
jgi:hypothetical protein